MNSDAIVVFMTAANGEEATRLADMLVGAHLAACVQILPEMESVYRWQGKIERQSEVILLVKTTRVKFDELEIIAVPVITGSAPYLDWLKQATDPHG
jgi:periplasmic divalent cation tolerance protein